MKPSPNEVLDELVALQGLAKRMPTARRNLVIVMEALESRMSTDEVYDTFDTEDPQFQYALDAAMWLAGEAESKPSEGWE